MPLGALVGGLVSGIFGQVQQKKYLKAQEQENLNAFRYNQMLAQQQNAFNVAQWNRANNYNLPKNQVQRLKDAGLNPNLMYSNGTSGLTAVQSPSMSAGSPYQPVDYTMNGGRKTIGDTIANSLDMALKKAQVDNLNADSEKKGSEKEGIDLSNSRFLLMSDAQLKEAYSRIGYNEEQTKNAIEQRNILVKEGQKIDTEIEHIRATISDISISQVRNLINDSFNNRKIEQEIKNLQSQFNLTNAQVDEIRRLLPFKIEQLLLSNSNLSLQGELLAGDILLQTSEQILKSAETSVAVAKSKGDKIKYDYEAFLAANPVMKLSTALGTLVGNFLPILRLKIPE